MSSVFYLIILVVIAVSTGMAMTTTGSLRRNFLVTVIVLTVISVLDMTKEVHYQFITSSIQKHVAAVMALGAQTLPTPQTPFKPFYVYRDKNSFNHFTPSGYMPDGKCVSVDDAWLFNAKEGKSCTRIVYDTACSRQRSKWAGIYWQNPANNWGAQNGGYDLTGATALVFWARGEKGGERIEEFKVGGLGAKELYPDSTSIAIGPVILTKEWQEYTIDLRGKDLSYIGGGFAWSAKAALNPDMCTFYIDDIHFE